MRPAARSASSPPPPTSSAASASTPMRWPRSRPPAAAASCRSTAEDPGAEVWRHDIAASAFPTPIWPWLLLLAIVLVPLDVGVRRVALPRSDLRRARAWAARRVGSAGRAGGCPRSGRAAGGARRAAPDAPSARSSPTPPAPTAVPRPSGCDRATHPRSRDPHRQPAARRHRRPSRRPAPARPWPSGSRAAGAGRLELGRIELLEHGIIVVRGRRLVRDRGTRSARIPATPATTTSAIGIHGSPR